MKVPFNRPTLSGNEAELIGQALAGGHLAGDGPFTKRCHALLEGLTGAKKVLLTTSCTHALEMCGILLGIEPGDEVIVPSFTFVSTANAFVLRGARPVFVDVRPDTLNIDERLVAAKITERTRAIVPVHYAGVACEMDELVRIGRERGVAVVEDNAHGLFGRHRGRPLGSLGTFATLSFHETKNLTCGEGGALLVNAAEYAERAEIIREKGTNRSQFFRGQVDKYSWVDVGSSYLPSDILAAVLLSQLEAADRIQEARATVWTRYRTELDGWATDNGVRLPVVPDGCEHPSHLFYLLLPDLEARRAFIVHMAGGGVATPFHYVPLHTSTMGRKLGYRQGDCPVTEDVSDRLARLPLFPSLTPAEQAHVIERVLSFRAPKSA